MKTRTIDVKPGDKFTINIPADGREPTMTKQLRPHEETWTSDGTDIGWPSSPYGDSNDVRRARVHLAAAAPAMARLLLELMGDPDLDDYAHTRIEEVLRAAGVQP